MSDAVASAREILTRYAGAREAEGRRPLVANPSGVDDDLVQDVREVLTSVWACPYRRRAVANRARLAVQAVTGDAS